MTDPGSLLETIIDAETADGPMAVVVKRPATDPDAPVVVLFLDAPGIRESLHEYARRLAGEGFTVALPDLHHRHGRLIGYEASEMAADPDLGAKIRAMLTSMTDTQIQDDLDATLDVLGAATAQPMGCIGFCLGARAVYRTLERLPDRFTVGAMWHPSFLADDEPDSPHLTAGSLKQSLYIGIGDADEVQSIAMHQRFFDAVEPLGTVDIEVFAGADHGFTWPTSPKYHAEAASVSWDRTLALLSSLKTA